MKTKTRSIKRPRLSVQDRIDAKWRATVCSVPLPRPMYPIDEEGSTHYILGYELNDQNEVIVIFDSCIVPIPELIQCKASLIELDGTFKNLYLLKGLEWNSLIGKRITVCEAITYTNYRFYHFITFQ